MSVFDTYLTPVSRRENEFTLNIPSGFEQGRGAYGGLVLGVMQRCVEAFLDMPDRPLRSLDAQLLGPVLAGEATVRVEPLRLASNIVAARALLTQNGEIATHLVAVFGRTRPVDLAWDEIVPPELPPPDSLPVLDIPKGVAPAFTEHFAFRIAGPLPYMGVAESRTAGWVQTRLPMQRPDAGWVLALADAWWLTPMVRCNGPRPAATLTFGFQLLCDPSSLDPSQPLFHRGYTPRLQEGYGIDDRELWSPDGRLVARNQQVMVLIK